MDNVATITGVVVQGDCPDWAPLEALVGSDLAGWFMWMFEVCLDDGSRLHAYKHVMTRCYFHLSTDGRAFDYTAGGSYAELCFALAIVRAFAGWTEDLRGMSKRAR